MENVRVCPTGRAKRREWSEESERDAYRVRCPGTGGAEDEDENEEEDEGRPPPYAGGDRS
jgi:hypothetical protein